MQYSAMRSRRLDLATIRVQHPLETMNDNAHMIADTTRRIFRELGDPQSMQTDDDHHRLWSALETAGLTRTWIPDELNGSGASQADGFEVVRIAGEFAISVPLAETL